MSLLLRGMRALAPRVRLYNTSPLPTASVLQASLHTSSHPRGIFSQDTKTKDVTVWSSVKDMKHSPVPALVLGVSGLIPFVGAPAYMLASGVYCSTLALMQVAYGASILSFLGGVRWGFTLYEENPVQPDWVNLGYSIVPSLVAWAGILMPNPWSCLTLILGLTASGYCDMAMYGYPTWFKGLRFLMTFFAVLSLWTVFMCGWVLPTSRENPKWKQVVIVDDEDTGANENQAAEEGKEGK
jgi:hypothetical protein